MLVSKYRRRLGHGGELCLGRRGRADGIVGKGGEHAVRVQQDALSAKYLDGAFGMRKNFIDGLGAVVLLVDHADPDAKMLGQAAQDRHPQHAACTAPEKACRLRARPAC